MFRPCIDLHNGKVKQIVGGSLTDSGEQVIENFISDQPPDYYAQLFKKDGLKGGHVIMLGQGNEVAALEALRAYPKGLQVGGGITPKNAMTYLEAGASHVIVTSYIFNNGSLHYERLEEMVKTVGRKSLILDLSCRLKNGQYYVVTDRWQKFTDFVLSEKNLIALEGYCDEFLIHGVDVEGKQQGMDDQLVAAIAQWTHIPVTYAGGIRAMSDIERIEAVGKGRVHYTVGSALDIFGGPLSYEALVRYHKGDEK